MKSNSKRIRMSRGHIKCPSLWCCSLCCRTWPANRNFSDEMVGIACRILHLSLIALLFNPSPEAVVCRKSRSQFGEEKAVISYFNWTKKQHGVYVEIGAMDGLTMSNTILLHTCMNWSGILVEGSPQAFSALQRNAARYRERNVQVHLGAVCAPPRTHLTFSTRSSTSGAAVQGDIEQMPPMLRETFGYLYNSSTVETPCKPMAWYLQSVSHVDFFSLDVEGSELEVLETIDFRAVTIEVFMVEFLDQNPKTWKIHNLLRNLGYLECRPRRVRNRRLLPLTLSILFVRESGPYTEFC
ncbi:unnamed protein product [Polarella glacialis]|uniref:Methyltransferase FkbM domain-containing protein n=1 Tax=Polarella glacialis TaxID=89957 RepID=A0A813K4W0_POLGL|nr:unnamed protein product [Polarella glacialis]